MTTKSGCTKCCGIILADTEDWENPLCHAHWVAIGSPEVEPKSEAREFWIYDHDRGRGNPDLVVHLAKKIYTSKHPPHETHVIEMKAYTDLLAKHERVLQALKEASKRSTYEWTDGYDYFPSDHANEGRIALANELITIIEAHNERLEK